VAAAQAFWLGREAHTPKCGIRDKQQLDGEDFEDPLCEDG